ncbi:DUF349 domain-containing protein [Marinicella meishanensis]|uniref:DUF349 domain-containing protein n=1 Tax=Marinicella meishanensis TaxID=2873263 RepID=UPI001CBE9395|nr:DUF349 domain-containing protein [Marinicella sp. NBU2979]
MSILQWFNKPKWQSPNEQVRITAIKSTQDPVLIDALLDIVNNDPSDKVQKTALSRIKDLSDLLSILNNHPNKAVRQQAGKKINHIFSHNDSHELVEWLEQVKEPEVIRTLAKTAANTQVRKSAISQISQQGLLSELLLTEPDTDLQDLILEQIEQPTTLKRLANNMAKSHTELHAKIQDKLATKQRLKPADEAIQLCQLLEHVVLDKTHQPDLEHIQQQWQGLQDQVDKTIQTRFNGAFSAAKMTLDPEHRREFLRKQKVQRGRTMMAEITSKLKQTENWGLPDIQALIGKHQSIEQEALPADEQAESQALKVRLEEIRAAVQKSQQIPKQVTQILDQLQQALSQPVARPDQLKQFKKRWSQATQSIPTSEVFSTVTQDFNDACLKLAEKIEHSAQKRDQAAKDAVAMIEPTLQEIKDGHLTQAKAMANELAELKKLAGFNHPIIKQNKYPLDSVWQQLKDLRKWQKWSNDKARQDIIDELQTMVGQGQHPDAVMKKLKEANERWYALEDMEKLPGDRFPSRNQKMWQAFRAVSKSLFEPTQPFFEKRNEQQNAHLGDIQTHIEAMQTIDLAEASERDLSRMSRQAINYLKSLDELPPKQRGKAAKNLRKAINRIDQKLSEFYAIAERKKLKLIEQAQALSEVEDMAEATHAAKQLQQQWKSAGMVKQHQERKLWKKFRQANDAVFNRLDQAKQAQNEAHQAQRKAANAFIKTQQSALKKAPNSEALLQLRATALQGWDALDKPAKMLDHEYNHLLHNIDQAIKQAQFKATLQCYENKQRLDGLYTQLEQGQIDAAEFEQKSSKLLDADMQSLFQQRKASEGSNEQLAALLIQGEFITGLETPEDELEARMAYQVKVLSQRMAGDKTPDNHNQAMAWLDHWYTEPKADASYLKQNQKRIKALIKAMTQLMME